MSYEDIIRAWKDAEYRMSLSEEERAQLPDNPAGLIELTDADLAMVGGGYDFETLTWCTISECSLAFCPKPQPQPDPTVTVNGQICCSSYNACITATGCG